MKDISELRSAYEAAGQSHLFKYWDQLGGKEQETFAEQLARIENPAEFMSQVQQAIHHSTEGAAARRFVPLPKSASASTLESSPEQLSAWSKKGLELAKQGKVGVILLAGGQGSRLGSSAPKGCYDVGLPSHKSLFQLQCERLLKLEQLAGAQIPLYIMTSGATRAATESFFQKNGYFGLKASQVVFFNQGVLPAVSMDGTKLLLGSRSSLAESPDGNGGLYRALLDNGLLQEFARRGTEHIHMYCVDNVLVKIADPVFLGYAASNGFDIATKVVRKRDAAESVGLIVLDEATQKPSVIEYSEISQELREKTDEAGLLQFRAANIVNHYYRVEFLADMVPKWVHNRSQLPYHIARKKIAVLDPETDTEIRPSEPNGIKLEQFIFDVFSSVELNKFGCLEVDRLEEFSPLKNASGAASDSPESCRESYLCRGTRWLVAAGGKLASSDALVDLDPLVSYSGEGLGDFNGVYGDGEVVKAK